jgi:hypothetical protein
VAFEASLGMDAMHKGEAKQFIFDCRGELGLTGACGAGMVDRTIPPEIDVKSSPNTDA